MAVLSLLNSQHVVVCSVWPGSCHRPVCIGNEIICLVELLCISLTGDRYS